MFTDYNCNNNYESIIFIIHPLLIILTLRSSRVWLIKALTPGPDCLSRLTENAP